MKQILCHLSIKQESINEHGVVALLHSAYFLVYKNKFIWNLMNRLFFILCCANFIHWHWMKAQIWPVQFSWLFSFMGLTANLNSLKNSFFLPHERSRHTGSYEWLLLDITSVWKFSQGYDRWSPSYGWDKHRISNILEVKKKKVLADLRATFYYSPRKFVCQISWFWKYLESYQALWILSEKEVWIIDSFKIFYTWNGMLILIMLTTSPLCNSEVIQKCSWSFFELTDAIQ